MHSLLEGFGQVDLALLLNRLVLGLFFAISGFHKLFNGTRHASLVATLKSLHIPAVRFNQWWVPGVEFTAGLGIMVGCLSTIAALGLLCICSVACCTAGPGMVQSYQPIDEADKVDDWLYLPETLYLVLSLNVILMGPGKWSIDYYLITLIGG